MNREPSPEGGRAGRLLIFKPDGIGDFILSTGAIRVMADAVGEARLTLVVRDLLVPLARAQFPAACVVGLPIAEKRRVLNLFVLNLYRSLGPIREVRRTRFDAAVSFRHMRSYMQSLTFFSVRAARYFASENLLARNRRFGRSVVERLIQTGRAPVEVPYPDVLRGQPTEMEAHRRIVSAVLNREVSFEEILPVLKAEPGSNAYRLCAPISTMEAKDYPFAQWVEAFRLTDAGRRLPLVLTGSLAQRPRLEELARSLKDAGMADVEVRLPGDLPAFVDLVAGAAAVFTVDTAAAHIAAALDRPLLVLFSGLQSGMFAPWQHSERQCWLEALPKTRERRGRWCDRLPPSMVAEAIGRTLSFLPGHV